MHTLALYLHLSNLNNKECSLCLLCKQTYFFGYATSTAGIGGGVEEKEFHCFVFCVTTCIEKGKRSHFFYFSFFAYYFRVTISFV